MLTKEFAQEALVIAGHMQSLGQGISPAPGSPLYTLNKVAEEGVVQYLGNQPVSESTNQNLPDTLSPETMIDAILYATDVDINTINQTDGYMGPHAEAMDLQIESSKKRLLTIARMSRDHVMPLVKDLYERVRAGLESNALGKSSQFQVKSNKTPELFTDPSFATLVSNYKGLNVDSALPIGLYFDQVSETQLVDMVKTGMTTMDALIMQALGNPAQTLSVLWNQIFADTSVIPEGTLRDPTELRRSMFVGDDVDARLIGLFLLSNYVAKGQYDGGIEVFNRAGGETFREIETRALWLRDFAGQELNKRIKLYQSTLEEGKLVARYGKNEVIVERGPYETFLERGGSNEMLLGALFTRDREYTIEGVLAKGPEMEQVWERNLSMLMLQDKNNSEIHLRRMASEVFRSQIQDAVDAGAVADNFDFTRTMEIFSKIFDSLTQTELSNFHLAATKLICGARYPNTPFQQIILDMFQIAKENPKLDPGNVATLAFVNYIGDWLADMIVLRRKS